MDPVLDPIQRRGHGATSVPGTVTKDAERRKQLLQAVQNAAKRDGQAPGIRAFCSEVGAGRHLWRGVLWQSWSAFLEEAGLSAGVMSRAVPEEQLLGLLAELTRELGRFPSASQLAFAHKRKQGFPTETVFRRRFGRLPEIFERLLTWGRANPNGTDLVELLERSRPSTNVVLEQSTPTGRDAAGVGLSDSFLPPVVSSLGTLAAGDPRIDQAHIDIEVEFEKRVAVAFQLLGFEVERLGQGAGRVADGIARCVTERWAVVYDAKVRRDGYVMGTEDRKFLEYIRHHGADLEREGFKSIYFAVVSSRFRPDDVEKAREVVRQTQAKGFVLLEADVLQRLIERKLSRLPKQDWPALERLFAKTGVVAAVEN